MSEEDPRQFLMTAEINQMGMPLTAYKWKGAYCEVGVGDSWATVYICESSNPGHGEMQTLLSLVKNIYRNKDFGCTVALNETMKHILQKLGIKEYSEEKS